MAALNLLENTIYELAANTAEDDKCGRKSVLHVKLTDSALKAIEEFHNLKDARNNASIKFEGNQGVIQIPYPNILGGSDADEENTRKFGFLLASVYGGQDGSFECIRQTSGGLKRKSAMAPLESVGVMTHKLTVQASEDVYQKTLVKMSLAEEESKKSSNERDKAKWTKHITACAQC